jgi:hypothetical protein
VLRRVGEAEPAIKNGPRDLLAQAYSWFTESFDTLDLKQAKVLLDGLAQ